jgi:small-conductance mechanosensitive channel
VAAESTITVGELHAIINERERSNNQRFDAQEKAVAAALAAAEKAVTKAELAAEKRFDAVNEFRGQLKDQADTFATRNEIDIRFRGIEEKIASAKRESTDGARWLWGVLIGAAGIVIAVIALLLRPAVH